MTKKPSASSRQGLRRRVKSGNIMPTKKMTNELKSIKKRAINLTDKNAPEITDWKKAVTGKFYRPVKKQITVRIDADVLAWFRLTAEKYQTLINTACREYMTHHKVSRKKTKQKRASF